MYGINEEWLLSGYYLLSSYRRKFVYMRVSGHISKLVPLGGNFRNAFINPILEILECLNLLL